MVHVIQCAGCHVVGDNDLLSGFTWCEDGGVSLGDQESVRSDGGVTDEESYFVMEVTTFCRGHFSGHEVTASGAATVTAILSGFPRGAVEERCIGFDWCAPGGWVHHCVGHLVDEFVNGARFCLTRGGVSTLVVRYDVQVIFAAKMFYRDWYLVDVGQEAVHSRGC